MDETISKDSAVQCPNGPSVYVLISVFIDLKKKKITAREAALKVAQECEPLFDEYLKSFSEIITEKIEEFFTFNDSNILEGTEFESCMENLTGVIKENLYGYIEDSITGISLIKILDQAGFAEMGRNWLNMAKNQLAALNSQQVMIAENLAVSATAYIAFSLAYTILQQSLDSAKSSYEERLRMEAECAESIERIIEYRKEMEEVVSKYLVTRLEVFEDGFKMIDRSLAIGDSDGYLAGNKKIQEILGYESQFSNQMEFDELMDSEFDFKL